MAGIEPAADLELRGNSFVPLLKSKTPANWSQDYYGEYHMINYAEADMRCYRTPEWKLIRDFKNEDRDELYHLKEDPTESHNVIDDESPAIRDIIKRLDTQLNFHINLTTNVE